MGFSDYFFLLALKVEYSERRQKRLKTTTTKENLETIDLFLEYDLFFN